MPVNHSSGDFNQLKAQAWNSVEWSRLKRYVGSCWHTGGVPLELMLDPNITRMSFHEKDDRGGHANIRLRSEAKFSSKKGYFSVHVGLLAGLCTMLVCFSDVLTRLYLCRWPICNLAHLPAPQGLAPDTVSIK